MKEHIVVGLVLDEKIDDLMPLLNETDRAFLRAFEDDLWYDMLKFSTAVNAVLRNIEIGGVQRKEFALASETMEPMLRAAVFEHFDIGSCDVKYVVDVVRKHLDSESAFNKVKGIIKTASWREVKSDDRHLVHG